MLVDGEWKQRDDDKPETVRHRLQVYREQTSPLSGLYEAEGLLSRIDAIGEVEEVTARALAALGRPGGAEPSGNEGERGAVGAAGGTPILARIPLLAKWSGRMIQIKTPQEIELMRASGLVTAGAIRAVKAAVRPGVSTGELDAVAEDYIRSHGAIPNFLGYHGFTGTICASINDEIVHGIPNRERKLAEGDNISIDCGAILSGWHSDSAVTVTVGEPSAEDAALLDVTERSMWAGLAKAVAGGRLTDISHAVEEVITAEKHPYGIVDHYGGHGIGTEMHQDPHGLNYGRAGRGPKLG